MKESACCSENRKGSLSLLRTMPPRGVMLIPEQRRPRWRQHLCELWFPGQQRKIESKLKNLSSQSYTTSSRQHRLLQQHPPLFLPALPPTYRTDVDKDTGAQRINGAEQQHKRKTMSYKNPILEQLSWSRSPEQGFCPSREDLTDLGIFRVLPRPLPKGVFLHLSSEYCRMHHVTS